jgi:hypothetical protein
MTPIPSNHPIGNLICPTCTTTGSNKTKTIMATYLITGANRGIGYAYCQQLHDRDSQSATATPTNDKPQPAHADTGWMVIVSGAARHSKVVPGCPGWPPLGRSLGARKLFVRFPNPSPDGGLLLLRLFLLS